jgi:hypothetical protein
MDHIGKALSALVAAFVIGGAAQAEPLPTSLCEAPAASYVSALDAGSAVDVMLAVLEDSRAPACLAQLDADAAQDWFAVLFHPEFVNRLVAQDEADQAQWSHLADILEAAYIPSAANPANASG